MDGPTGTEPTDDKTTYYYSVNLGMNPIINTTPLSCVSQGRPSTYAANKKKCEISCICLIPAFSLENKPYEHPISLMNAYPWANLNGVVLKAIPSNGLIGKMTQVLLLGKLMH